MKTAFATLPVLLLSIVFAAPSSGQDSTLLQTTFKAHCFTCHGNDGEAEGEVNLLTLKYGDDLQARPELLQRLITVLSDRQMPPEDEPALPEAKRKELVSHLQSRLAQALKNQPFNTTPIRRMNRFQYNNAVVDLLELDRDIFQLNERLMRRREDYFQPESGKMPNEVRISSRPLSKDIDNQRPEGFRGVAPFPQDKRAEHGFDNRADHLTMSPLLMESFLQLSQSITQSPDLNPRECRSWDRLFAAPGKPARGFMEGRYEAETASRIKVAAVSNGPAGPQDMRGFGSDWSGSAQLFWQCPSADASIKVSFDVKTEGTGFLFAFTKAGDYGTFQVYLDDVEIGKPVDLFDPKVVRTKHQISDLKIKPGPHTLTFKCVGKNGRSAKHFWGLDYLDVTGQKQTAKPNDSPNPAGEAIRSRLAQLLRRAFRRPVDPTTLDRFTDFAERQLAAGASFEETMRTMVGVVLGMPEFLYLYDLRDDDNLTVPATTKSKPSSNNTVRQRVDDFELASRLAQFFWSSIPDDTLLDLADAGKLSEPATLSAQIDRMLNDRRSSRFCENFPAQWLQLERLVTSIPDPKKFPYFYYHGYRTSMHMMSEPLLLFETVYVEDRSIVELLDPKFTWQSDMLRSNYEGKAAGGHDVQVQLFKRVALTDPRRGGVITNAAILTMTSTPTRTQPITRGAWVNAVIFNDPPDPPPADVPLLAEGNHEELAKLTIRERLAAHRKRADCASCHNKIDPFGFALENYGPTGVWRDKYENGREVDVSGVLFNQHKFKDVLEFKRLILKEKQRFIRGFSSHVLSYALGRELGPADWPALEKIAADAAAGDDRMRTLLKSIAMSDPFLHKSTRGVEETKPTTKE
jgi:mono/diheme cytochrome c family protein